eukprot:CAMPEP_0204836356 /NCGR_PEP_ID=MMETSP1346-20131115/24905_1 /ASSEMBLY_ACC=CAM_ASM_000771 /TAXON_ID=215587 /ORGANISM="Aplanochytrium stocchinoi, Strain GSBS06" /LENGTH=401 /DNA_ID=CAMNT_0051970989 /DNA_START=53 /DNA_END=1258 /DNA_ORIENTATION=-
MEASMLCFVEEVLGLTSTSVFIGKLNPVTAIRMAIKELGEDKEKYWLGESPLEKAKVSQWVSFTKDLHHSKDFGEGKKLQVLMILENELKNSSFLGSKAHQTLADVAIYFCLHELVSSMKPQQLVSEFPAVARWFNQAQNSTLPKKKDVKLKLIDFVLPDAFDLLGSNGNGANVASSTDKNKGKKGKMDKAKPDGKGKVKNKTDNEIKKKDTKPSKPVAADAAADQPLITMLDIRVGRIVSIEKHPEKDKIYCEQIELGEEKPRSIASGLVEFYPEPSVLVDRKVLVLCNLKPRKMGNFMSNGMVLCASNPDKSKVEVVDPPEAAQVGDKVSFPTLGDNSKYEAWAPSKVAKKKIFENVAPNLKTNGNKEPVWIGPDNKEHNFVVADAKCSVPTISDGNVS